jgi:hypothetical protein
MFCILETSENRNFLGDFSQISNTKLDNSLALVITVMSDGRFVFGSMVRYSFFLPLRRRPANSAFSGLPRQDGGRH